MEAYPVGRVPNKNGSAGDVAPSTVAPRVAEHNAEPAQLPKQQRLSAATLAGLAAAAGAAAIALGAWAFLSSWGSDDATAGRSSGRMQAPALSVVSFLLRRTTQRIPVTGSAGRITLAVGSAGRGILVLDGFRPAAAGRSYQAWVIEPRARRPASAAVFSGATDVVPLSKPVRPGSTVSITVERAGGVSAPTRAAQLVAHRS